METSLMWMLPILQFQVNNKVTTQLALYFVQEQGESAQFISINEHFQRSYWTK